MEYQGWDEILIFNLISRKSGGCMRNTVQTTHYCLHAKRNKKKLPNTSGMAKNILPKSTIRTVLMYILWNLFVINLFCYLSTPMIDISVQDTWRLEISCYQVHTDFCHFDDVENMYRLVHVVLEFRSWDLMTYEQFFLMVQI